MGALCDCFRPSTTEQTRSQSSNVITPDTDARRQAAAEAAYRRLQQNETRGVDEDELHRFKQRHAERERLEQLEAKLSKQTGGNNGGLRWQMN